MKTFIELIYHLNQWHWFGFACILVIFEIGLGVNFFLLWLGLCAASIGIIVTIFPSLPWEYQFIIFAISAVACIMFWHMYLKNNPTISDKPNLNRRGQRYIGVVTNLKEPMINRRSKVQIEDSFWQVEGEEDLPAGTAVKVIAINSMILNVIKHD
jgi:membrane protein implicated in regulation of membrane protease activity